MYLGQVQSPGYGTRCNQSLDSFRAEFVCLAIHPRPYGPKTEATDSPFAGSIERVLRRDSSPWMELDVDDLGCP